MKDPILRSIAKDVLGMSDEDIDKITPEQEQGFKNAMNHMGKYRLVAEVVKSKYCHAGCKAGQKIVIDLDNSKIDTKASDCPLCPGAIAPLHRACAIVLDRYMQNGNITAPLEGIDCVDPGFDNGGLGTVVFNVRVEPIS